MKPAATPPHKETIKTIGIVISPNPSRCFQGWLCIRVSVFSSANIKIIDIHEYKMTVAHTGNARYVLFCCFNSSVYCSVSIEKSISSSERSLT